MDMDIAHMNKEDNMLLNDEMDMGHMNHNTMPEKDANGDFTYNEMI